MREDQLTWLFTKGGRATPLVRLRSDTITLRIFSIYRRRKRRSEGGVNEGRVRHNEQIRQRNSKKGKRLEISTLMLVGMFYYHNSLMFVISVFIQTSIFLFYSYYFRILLTCDAL